MLTGMVKTLIVLILVTGGNAIAADNGSGDQVPAPPPSPHPGQLSMKLTDWNLNSGNLDTRLSQRGGGSLHFDFLVSKSDYYLVTTASPPLTQGWYLEMQGKIVGSQNGKTFREPPEGLPAQCWMYFEEVDRDLFGKGQYARWWSTKSLALHSGYFAQIVGLEPEFWSSVTGERGDASAAATAGFQRALANPQSIGIECRGAYIASPVFDDDIHNLHNVYLDDATFLLGSFAVCDPFQLRHGPFRDAADAFRALQENAPCALPNAQQR
jgi:hypothetical protein